MKCSALNRKFSFSFLDSALYAAAAGGGGFLLLESRPFWSATLGITAVFTFGVIALIFSRQVLAIKKNLQDFGERQAQRSKIRFQSFVEHSTDMITIRDSAGKVAFRSPSVRRILGYTEEELDAMQSNELIHPDDLHILRKSYGQLASGEVEVFKCEYRVKHENGSWLVIEGYATNYGGLRGRRGRDVRRFFARQTNQRRLEAAAPGASGRLPRSRHFADRAGRCGD